MLKRLFRKSPAAEPARQLYESAVAQGRQPVFYTALGVPDSVDGRFDLICLHIWLLQRRLPRGGAATAAVAQELAEIFFADMDVSLREMGAADIGVGRRVKKMIEGFTGRAQAYDAALLAGPEALAAALSRNLYGRREAKPGQLAAIARYVLATEVALAAQDEAVALAGGLRFPPPPESAA